MKKTYTRPGIIIVQLQHQGLLMQSVANTQSNANVNYGGANSNNTGGIVRTKESGNI